MCIRDRLDTVCERLNVSLENHHRAVDDAGATAEIFIKCIPLLKEKGVNKLNPVSYTHLDVYKRQEHITVYAFSTENWKRANDEVSGLMNLMREYIQDLSLIHI